MDEALGTYEFMAYWPQTGACNRYFLAGVTESMAEAEKAESVKLSKLWNSGVEHSYRRVA